MRRTRKRLLPFVPSEPVCTEPTRNMAEVRFLMDYRDNCPEWEAELIDEFGFKRAVEAARKYATPERARAALEAERLRNQEYRWTLGKGRLPQGW